MNGKDDLLLFVIFLAEETNLKAKPLKGMMHMFVQNVKFIFVGTGQIPQIFPLSLVLPLLFSSSSSPTWE